MDPSTQYKTAVTSPANKAEAVSLLELAASQNHVDALCRSGLMNFWGEGGLLVNKAEAARLLELAASQNHAIAQCHLAYMYENGDGVLEDKHRATLLYREAALQGDTVAQFGLGRMCYCGPEHVDKREALRLFRLSADQGNCEAQYALGTMHLLGEGGLPQNTAKGVDYIRLSAAQGNSYSLCLLGQLSLSVTLPGLLPLDVRKAVELFRCCYPMGKGLLSNMIARCNGK